MLLTDQLYSATMTQWSVSPLHQTHKLIFLNWAIPIHHYQIDTLHAYQVWDKELTSSLQRPRQYHSSGPISFCQTSGITLEDMDGAIGVPVAARKENSAPETRKDGHEPISRSEKKVDIEIKVHE